MGPADVTGPARKVREGPAGDDATAEALLSAERAYPLPDGVAARSGASMF